MQLGNIFPLIRRRKRAASADNTRPKWLLPSELDHRVLTLRADPPPAQDLYPPPIRRTKTVPIEDLIYQNRGLIHDIADQLGFNNEQFDRLFMSVVARLADFIYLLPSSQSSHHRGPGGAFTHALEVAKYVSIAIHDVVLDRKSPPSIRRVKDPMWRLIAVLSGLCHDVGKPFADIRVFDANGNEWSPYEEGLYSWVVRHSIESYTVDWLQGRYKLHELHTARAVNYILPDHVISYINQIDPLMMRAFHDSFMTYAHANFIAKLVSRADQRSVYLDIRKDPVRSSDNQANTGLRCSQLFFKELLLELNEARLSVNQVGSLVWHTKEGTFLQWEQLVPLIMELIASRTGEKISISPTALACDVALSGGLLLPQETSEDQLFAREIWPYWEISPTPVGKPEGFNDPTLRVVKLKEPERLFTDCVLPSKTSCRVHTVVNHHQKQTSSQPNTSSQSEVNDATTDVTEMPVMEAPPVDVYESDSLMHSHSDDDYSSVDSDTLIEPVIGDLGPQDAISASDFTSVEDSPPLDQNKSWSKKLGLVSKKDPEQESFLSVQKGKAKGELDSLKAYLDSYADSGAFIYQSVCYVLFTDETIGMRWSIHDDNVVLHVPEGVSHGRFDPDRCMKEILGSELSTGSSSLPSQVHGRLSVKLKPEVSQRIKKVLDAFEPLIDPSNHIELSQWFDLKPDTFVGPMPSALSQQGLNKRELDILTGQANADHDATGIKFDRSAIAQLFSDPINKLLALKEPFLPGEIKLANARHIALSFVHEWLSGKQHWGFTIHDSGADFVAFKVEQFELKADKSLASLPMIRQQLETLASQIGIELIFDADTISLRLKAS